MKAIGKSLSMSDGIYTHYRLLHKFKTMNKNARLDKIPQVSWEDYKDRYGYHDAVKTPIGRLRRYRMKATYNNNFTV